MVASARSAALVTAVGALAAWRRDRRLARGWLVLGCAALAVAITTEAALRRPSTMPLGLYNRVTFYSGLLATHPGPTCGRWTEEAAAATAEDLDRPLVSAARARLTGRWGQVPAIASCKLSHFVNDFDVGPSWLSKGARVAGLSHRPMFATLRWTQKRGGRALELVLVVALVVGTGRAWRHPWRGLAIAIPWAVVLGYLGLHTVLEIQARYLIDPVVLGLVACWLAFGPRGVADPRRGA